MSRESLTAILSGCKPFLYWVQGLLGGLSKHGSLTSGGGAESERCLCWVQGLLGGLSNVLETLRGEGVPPPACRAVVHAALRFVDAELLNALMLRRDCCSISAIKVLQVRRLPSPSMAALHALLGSTAHGRRCCGLQGPCVMTVLLHTAPWLHQRLLHLH